MSRTAVLALASARVCAYPPYPSSPVLTSRCRLLCLVGSAFISVRRPGPRGRGACTRSAPRSGALLKRAPPRESPARCGPWAPRRPGGSGVVVSGFGDPVSGFRCRVSGFGFQVPGFRFRVSGFRFRVSGFRFQVSGFRFQVEQLFLYFFLAFCI